MSLLPDDNDEPISLLPPEEQNAPTPDMFVEGGGNLDYEERKKLVIPKYKNLMPRKVIARWTGITALVVDLIFGALVYTNIKPYLDTIPTSPFDWSQLLNYIWGSILYLLNNLKGRNLIIFILIGVIALMVTAMWAFSERKISKCPACKKKNYNNYNSCAKCDYIFYTREIIDREILSIKLNNLDFEPKNVGDELRERRLADLTPKYIKHILAKNHFL
nr:hypothetical protein [Candidatus Sigynarchaeota archaeon]